MTDSMIEDPGNVIAGVPQAVTEDFATPKKKKKKNKNKIGDDDALDFESSSSVERQKVSDSLSAESQNAVKDCDGAFCFNFLSPKKKKKTKQENVDEHDVSESTKRKTVEDVENQGDTEECNTSMIEDESSVATHKKKKKASFDESIDESQANLVYEDGNMKGCNTSMVDDESSGTPHKKKKKKKKADFDESIDAAQTNLVDENEDTEGCNTSMVNDDESSGTPHKKKKKKKKADFDESIDAAQTNLGDENEDTEGCNTSMVDDESSGTSHKKKKKKKKVDFEESIDETHINSACVENGDTEGFNAKVDQEEIVKLSNKKKKKRKVEDDAVIENGLSASEMEDENEHLLRGEGLMRKKKKKREDDVNAENDPKSVNDTMEDETAETMQESALLEEIENGRSNDIGGFTLIDEVKGIKRRKVDRVLPEWLSNPTVVSMKLRDGVPIGDLKGLDRYFLKRLKKERIKNFFPVQAAVIPELVASSKSISMRYRPRDICISAPTGSGKTLAYVLPIIQALRSRVVPQLRALVILPTQELAIQVHSVFVKYTKLSKLKVVLAVGSHNFKKEQTALVFQDTIGDCAADILVATPGKLSDHLSFTDRLSFKHLRFLVMDEADLFLSSSGGSLMVKIEQLKKRIHRPTPDNSVISGGFQPSGSSHLPEPYLQQILVSATLMHDPEQLKVLNLHQPKLYIANSDIEATGPLEMVGPYMRPQEIREEYLIVDSTLKPLVLHHLIHSNRLHSVLVFTKSTTATRTLSVVLSAMSKHYTVAQFSSKEGRRKQILEDFSSKKIDVLVSSDAMARGIDISGIEQVISYDVPSVTTYVHRTGRTGRAGKRGFALTLVENTPESKRDFKPILTSCRDRLTKINVTQKELKGYGVQYQEALAFLKETTLKEKKTQKLNKIKRKLEQAKKLKAKKKKFRENT